MKKLFSIFSLLALLVSNVLPAYTYADTGDNSVIEEDNEEILVSEDPIISETGDNIAPAEEPTTIIESLEETESEVTTGNIEQENEPEEWNLITNLVESMGVFLMWSWEEEEWLPTNSVKKTTLITWTDFSYEIKKLANPNFQKNDYYDDIIKYVKRSENDNENATTILSVEWSTYPVKAWFVEENWDWVIYYYTEADTIYLNPNSNYMFAFMRALKTVDLTEFDSTYVEKLSYMFYYDASLESLDFSEFNTPNLKEMGSIIRYSTTITWIDLSSFDTSHVTYMTDLFEGCTALETVIIDNWDLRAWSSIWSLWQGIFYDNPNLTYVSARNWKVPTNLNRMMYDFFYGYNWLRWVIDVTDWDTSLVTNMSNAFYWIDELTWVIWLNTWDTSNVTDMNHMFQSSKKLESLDLSWWNTSRVEDMSSMFEYCHSLKEIKWLDTWNTSNVKKMGCMFYECKNLKSLNLDNWDLRNLRSYSNNINFAEWGSSMVYNDNSLKSISARNWKVPEDLYNWISYWWIKYVPLETLDVSNWDTSNVTKMNFMFTDITSETTIIWLETWDTSNVDNMRGMFTRSTWLTGLNLSNFDTSKVTQMDYMFSGATNLETIYIGSKFTTGSLESSTKMFDWGINLPNYDENITDIVWLPIYTINWEYSISYELDWWEFQGENIKNKYVIWEIAQLSIPYKTWSEFLWWFEEWSEIPFVLDWSKIWNKTLYAQWKSLEEKAEETTTENVVYTNTTTVTVWDEVTEEVLSWSSTLTLVSKEVEDTEVKKEEDTTKVQDTVIQVTSDKTVEYEWWLEVYLEKTENVGTENETTGKVEWTIKFSAPVAVKIPIVSDTEYVKVQVKHWDEDFGFKWLTLIIEKL